MTTTVQAPVCYGDTAAKMSKIESTKSPAAKNRNSGDMAKLGSRRFFNTPENIRHASSAARSKHRAKRTLSAGQPNAMIARCRLAGARSPSEGRTLDLSVPRLPRSAHLCRQGSQRAADEIQIRARPRRSGRTGTRGRSPGDDPRARSPRRRARGCPASARERNRRAGCARGRSHRQG
jgi:hypothetical protein